MRVYLDTSLFPTDFGLRSPRLQSVLATARDLGIQIVVPEVVVLELVAHYRDQLTEESETITRAERHIRQLFGYAGETQTFEAADIDRVVASYEVRLRAQLDDNGVEVGTLPEVMHRDLIARDLRRRKPFRRIVDAERGKDKGSTGYRDALIWETVARSAASDDVPIVLITQNKDDFAENGRLHSDLAADLERRGMNPDRVSLYTSLQDFIDDFVTPRLNEAEEVRAALESGEIDFRAWLSAEPLRLGGAEAFDFEQFGIPGYRVVGVQEVLGVEEVEFSTARHAGDSVYVEGTGMFDLDLVLSIDVSAFARATGTDATGVSDDATVSGRDRARVLANFNGTISSERIPRSASLTEILWLDPSSSLGELQSLAVRHPAATQELRRLLRLEERGLLTDPARRHLRRLGSQASYSELEAAHAGASVLAPRILEDLRSYNWDSQNGAVHALRYLRARGVETLEPATQEDLGRNILQAAEGESYRAEGLIRELVAFAGPWPGAFVQGLILECFVNERGEFRWKGRHSATVLEIVAKHPDACRILEHVSAAVGVSHPKEAWTAARGDYDAALDAVTLAARSSKADPIRESFQQLFDAVRNAQQSC